MTLVTIATFYELPEAHMARAKLEACGIESFLFDEHIISANFLYANAVGGAKLKVLDEHKELAKDILNDNSEVAAEALDPELQESYDPIETCPKCESDDITRERPHFLEGLVTLFLFSAPARLCSNRRTCNLCDHKWNAA